MIATHDFYLLADEHRVLMRHIGTAQARCSELVSAQAAEIARLQAESVQLRAAVIVRDTALAWAREDRAALEASIPGLPKRRTLARRVEVLMMHIQDLKHEQRDWQRGSSPLHSQPNALITGNLNDEDLGDGDLSGLEASLAAADLVICQTGCLSHGEYWRVQDHCKRSGKTCVLVEQPDALRIVRIHHNSTEQNNAVCQCIDAKEI